jgi:hypothetical protein
MNNQDSKILISVVNYLDPEFYKTIKSLWENADNQNNIYFSLVSQEFNKMDFSFIPDNQLFYKSFEPLKYLGGVCWARNLAIDVPVEYDFLMQLDSHTIGGKGWDTAALKSYFDLAKTKEKFIIAHAPSNYEYREDGTITTEIENFFAVYPKDYSIIVPGFTFPNYGKLRENEVKQSYWTTCCYLFAPKKWVDEVGIDGDESFNTEEISLSLRTYAKGWKIFAIGMRNVFHHTSHKMPDGVVTRKVFRPWADKSADDYWDHVKRSTNRLSLLLSGQLDVPKDKCLEFLEFIGISEKYGFFIENYIDYLKTPNPRLGMPPRPKE